MNNRTLEQITDAKRLRRTIEGVVIRLALYQNKVTSTIEIEAGLKMFGGGATGRLHPGSIEYSMANQSMLNTF